MTEEKEKKGGCLQTTLALAGFAVAIYIIGVGLGWW